MSVNNLMHESAKVYLSWGWSVLPVTAKSKEPHPLLEELERGMFEYEARFADEAEIDGWFVVDQKLNIAVMCGPISGLLVLDVDEAGEKPELMALLSQVQGGIPTVKTARGFHFYFRYPPGEDIGQRHKPYQWMDVRGQGDYVLLPPSIHPSGAAYEWLVSPNDGVDKTTLPEVPPALLKLIKASEGKFDDRSHFDDPDDDEQEDEDWDDDDGDYDVDEDFDTEASIEKGHEKAKALIGELRQGDQQPSKADYLKRVLETVLAEVQLETSDIDDYFLCGLVAEALDVADTLEVQG